ncbi:hypothetical protein [Kribbella sp. NPDC006257]|uniref:hypothetical protein n=1 Tax=Kribbella sp. NPDC006257 TaxID=3156738 RepID=UPI0033BE9C80
MRRNLGDLSGRMALTAQLLNRGPGDVRRTEPVALPGDDELLEVGARSVFSHLA